MLQRRSRTLSNNPFKRLRSLYGVFPIFIFLLFLFLIYELFVIRRIECTLNGSSCPAEITDKVNKYLGSNVLMLNQKALSSSIKASFPVEKVGLGFKIMNTLKLKIEGRLSAINAQVSLIQNLPVISLDSLAISSTSSTFTKPTEELDVFNQSIGFVNFDLWDTGLMTPSASAESKFKYLITDKPDAETVKSLYRLIKLVEKYLNVDQFIILDQRIFLRQANQPDIIVNVPFDEDSLVQALQSFTYLSTIKKDAKVIDLRFKNPILR